MDLGLSDRTALVTGGAGRLGSEDARHLAREGAEVVVLDVDEAGAERVVSDIEDDGGDALAVTCDLTDREDVRETLSTVREETGGVDVLVNNAGFVDAVARMGDFDDDLWDRDLELNLTGAYNVTKEVFPRMRERGWGRVITMASIAGTHGSFGQVSYSTTKMGLVGFGKTLALEGAKDGVTSNVLAPSIVVEDLADLPPEQLEQMNPQFERLRQATPMKELGREDDVAPMVCYLASEHARYITGQVIGITGGADLLST
ncbi:SDR family NAD(P)-dependent oxidoreductase [Haloarchaeobius amylolyticus]|uniref:SDR family NAD(P)-dependent oxidoreductase n=1 Tax=Haloarchaeobius amylolyticus TaxID=1198296 RepID=UPI002270FEB4|nr:SDR family NAD(P)-dependent oxidoreductase [Haloarchaeobius amylolyticus]